MIMKFFLFSSLAHLYLIVSSSVMPQYGDIEQKQYDDFGLLKAFHKYLTVPTGESYYSFRSYVQEYYELFPIDCLNLLDRYRSNRIFKVLFWHALGGSIEYIDPATITPIYYSKVLEWISQRIRWSFFNCSCSDEAKFKTELETISLMVKSAERIASELKSIESNEEIISGFDGWVITWNYLIGNISIDFANNTIDYYSLFRTINEIIILVNSSSSGPSLCLSKRYALLWVYLRHICNTDCNLIFEIHHHHKAFIFYLIIEFSAVIWDYDIDELYLYPYSLSLLFEKLYKNGSQQLDPISDLLGIYNLEKNRDLLGVTNKISNYLKLAHSLTESSKKYSNKLIWKIKALAELEVYLFRHGRKVDYSQLMINQNW